jgi:hypothetical protein
LIALPRSGRIFLESATRKAQHHSTLWATEVVVMTAPIPSIGEWYRHTDGDAFEVVAFDEDDGTIEIQYFDGTVEEMDTEDWDSQWADRALEKAEQPEDWSGSVDVESTDDSAAGSDISGDEGTLRASALDGIDMFE